MCGVVAGLIGGGAVLSAIANVKQGIDQRNAARTAARDTLASAEEEARDRIQRAAIDAGNIAAEGAAIAATHVAARGASNVSGGTTEAAELVSNLNAARDQETVKSNAMREAYGLRRQAARQASALKKQGSAAFTSGLLGATGSLIGGAGQAVAAGRYYGSGTGGSGAGGATS
jgi:hypothetical protein